MYSTTRSKVFGCGAELRVSTGLRDFRSKIDAMNPIPAPRYQAVRFEYHDGGMNVSDEEVSMTPRNRIPAEP
nr:hypothetical protein [uncultured bacterium]